MTLAGVKVNKNMLLAMFFTLHFTIKDQFFSGSAPAGGPSKMTSTSNGDPPPSGTYGEGDPGVTISGNTGYPYPL